MSKNNKNNAPETEEVEFFEFVDEEGNVEKFEILGFIEFEGNDYVALLPEKDDTQVHILEVVEELDSDYDTYLGIDNQALVDKIYEKFMKENKDRFNFVE
ncbi:MAG: DUF1292 domain-containing protein [Clostridia bacterium]|nr:DUF1292 domain-containing protein [Clostridia bacterium]